MSTFTPGPWHVWAGAIYQGKPNDDLSGRLLILPLESGALLEDIKDGEWDDHVNAKPEDLRLAAAAPDLLQELQNIVDADPTRWHPECRGDFQQWAQSRARAAIAKATGEQP